MENLILPVGGAVSYLRKLTGRTILSAALGALCVICGFVWFVAASRAPSTGGSSAVKAPPPAISPPQFVSDLSHDFGIVRPLAVCQWRFPLRNSSAVPWTVDAVVASCHCTVTALSSKFIEPGASESLDVELTVGGDIGDIQKSIEVRFQEADAPPLTIWVSAGVRGPISPSDSAIAFGDISERATASFTIGLNNYTDQDWTGLDAAPSENWLRVSVPEPTKRASLPDAAEKIGRYLPREAWSATVTADLSKLPADYHRGSVRFRASDGHSCEVPVWLHVSPPVRFVPRRLVFGPSAPADRTTLDFRVIFAPNQTPLAVGDAALTSDDPSMSFRISRLNDHVWNVRSTTMHRLSGEEVKGEIRLSWAHAELPVAELPFTVHTAPGEQP